LYGTTLCKAGSKDILEAAVTAFLEAAENGGGKLLYSVYYEQQASSEASLDLAFNDTLLESVEKQWKEIMPESSSSETSSFMIFEDRPGMDNEDDEADDGF
jgi:hypothetical protein